MLNNFLFNLWSRRNYMGSIQGATQSTTQETIQRTTVEPETCSLCMNRYQRQRQSICACSHCSLPLCFDCLHDHIDELPKNVAQLSHQFHELEELLQTKTEMVQQEVSKSNDEIKQGIKTYQNELVEAQHAIFVGIENAKQNADVIILLKRLFFNFLVFRDI